MSVHALPPCQTRQARSSGYRRPACAARRSAGELAHHPVDVPAAVAHHHVVRRVAELGAVALGLAQQPRQVQQRPARRWPSCSCDHSPHSLARSIGLDDVEPRAGRSRRRAPGGRRRSGTTPITSKSQSASSSARAGRWRPSGSHDVRRRVAARGRTRAKASAGSLDVRPSRRGTTPGRARSRAPGCASAVPRSKETREAMSGTSSRRASRARSRWRCTGSMPSTRKPKWVASRNGVGALPAARRRRPGCRGGGRARAPPAAASTGRAAPGSRRGARRRPPPAAGRCRRRTRDPRPRSRVCRRRSRVTGMARRVFLHVGTAKSGTSYLQDLWWRHHDELRDARAAAARQVAPRPLHRGRRRQGHDRRRRDARRPRARRLAAARRGGARSGRATCSSPTSTSPTPPPRRPTAALADLASASPTRCTSSSPRATSGGCCPRRGSSGSRWAPGSPTDASSPPSAATRATRSSGATRTCPGSSSVWSAGLPDERAHLVVVPASGRAARRAVAADRRGPRRRRGRSRHRGRSVPTTPSAWSRPSCCAGSTSAMPRSERVPRADPPRQGHVRPRGARRQRGARVLRPARPAPRLGRTSARRRSSPTCAPARTTSWATSTTCCRRRPATAVPPTRRPTSELLAAARAVLPRLGADSEPATLEEAVGLIAEALLGRVSPAAPDRAVPQPPSGAPGGGSGTALGRVLRRLTDQR